MQEFFRLFFTNRYWFVGTMFVIILFVGFIWKLIDPTGFFAEMNSFISTVWQIAVFILQLVIIILGVRLIFGWRPFKKPANNNNNNRH